MKKRLSVLLALAVALSMLSGFPVRADQIPNVTDYTYTVTPILDSFTYYLYIRTDNPDPTSFRLVDKESVFYDADSRGQIWETSDSGSYYTEVDPGTYFIAQHLYPDVVYEDESTFRVPGGYIFLAKGAYSDGGTLTLLQKTQTSDSILHDVFTETGVTVPCQPLHTLTSWLVANCTDESLPFFDNLDAVNDRLNQLAVYPRRVYDINSPNESRPYPFLSASIYPELSLNDQYAMYNPLPSGLLAAAVYPFVLDSLGYPGTIAAVARALEPECEAVGGVYHFETDITFEGETRTYGGAGAGGNDPLYSNRVMETFAFGDTQAPDIETVCRILLDYAPVAQEDKAQYADLIMGETFRQTIAQTGGTWIQVATEGFIAGTSYAYVVSCGSGYRILSDAWVDGRYVSNREIIYLHETFEDHPTADIVIRDMTYTDYEGQTHTQDVIFYYNPGSDVWTSAEFYTNGVSIYPTPALPDEMILTREEVAAMDIDSSSCHWPVEGLIYDGTVYPGEPFTNILVSGISVPETLEVIVEQEARISAAVTPADAMDARVRWTTSDASVAELVDPSNGVIVGMSEGTAVLTATTVDGAYSASCTVTVIADPCAGGHLFGEYVSDGNATCTGDGTMTAVCQRCGDTDTIPEPGTATGHTPGDPVPEDEAEDGSCYLMTYCDVCGSLLWWDYGAAYGDVNGDFYINTLDILVLRQYLAGWETDINLHGANVSGDPGGAVNTLDLLLLRQYLNGWDVTLGP